MFARRGCVKKADPDASRRGAAHEPVRGAGHWCHVDRGVVHLDKIKHLMKAATAAEGSESASGSATWEYQSDNHRQPPAFYHHRNTSRVLYARLRFSPARAPPFLPARSSSSGHSPSSCKVRTHHEATHTSEVGDRRASKPPHSCAPLPAICIVNHIPPSFTLALH